MTTTNDPTEGKAAANIGLAKSGRTILNQSFVLLINICGCRQVGASNAATSPSPEPLCAIKKDTEKICSNGYNF